MEQQDAQARLRACCPKDCLGRHASHVECRTSPSSAVVQQKIARARGLDAASVWSDLKPTDPVPINHEKICDVYFKLVKYVPKSMLPDPLYPVPSEENMAKAKVTKEQRSRAKEAAAQVDV